MRSIFPSNENRFCAVVEWIAAAAAVPQSDVEKAIGAEHQLAALMVGERLVYDQQDAFAVRVGLCWGPTAEVWNSAMTVCEAAEVARVIHVELAVGAVVGMEGQTQQALFLSVEVHQALDVEKISRLQGAIFDDADGPALFAPRRSDCRPAAFPDRADC